MKKSHFIGDFPKEMRWKEDLEMLSKYELLYQEDLGKNLWNSLLKFTPSKYHKIFAYFE